MNLFRPRLLETFEGAFVYGLDSQPAYSPRRFYIWIAYHDCCLVRDGTPSNLYLTRALLFCLFPCLLFLPPSSSLLLPPILFLRLLFRPIMHDSPLIPILKPSITDVTSGPPPYLCKDVSPELHPRQHSALEPITISVKWLPSPPFLQSLPYIPALSVA